MAEGVGPDGHKVGKKPVYMESIASVRVCRKPFRCDSCGEQIARGDEYVRHALPPTGRDASRGAWMTMRTCGWWTSECRRYWELDARKLRGESNVLTI